MQKSHDLKNPESHNQKKMTIIDDSVIIDKMLVQDPVFSESWSFHWLQWNIKL